MLHNLLTGFQVTLTPLNLLLIAAGTTLGVFVGALPGLSPTTGLAIILPFTFVLDPIPAFLMMIALYMAAEYGGSITAITIGVPGTPASVATTFDGYPLTKRGMSRTALGVSIISSTLGGLIGTLVLIVACGPISQLALQFGPAEEFALGLFGLSIVSNLVGEGVLKGFISAAIGLLFTVVGVDVMTGYPRFTFGRFELLDGVPLMPALIGFFALSEVFVLIEESGGIERLITKVSGKFPVWSEIKALIPTISRASAIGALVGAVPGAGATIASLIAYNEAKRVSKRPETFGTGALEGVSATEAANNASVGGAMIPLLTLGIPGSGSAAVLLGGLMVHGINPGPLLMVEHADLVYAIYCGFILSTLFMLAIGLLGIPLWTRVSSLSRTALTAVILGLSIVGSYALGNSMVDVALAVAFGVLGYAMRRLGFPLAPAVLALILGAIIESNYRRALSISGGSHMTFLTQPISLALLMLALVSFTLPLLRKRRLRMTE